jgi:hypothetical protein
MTDIVNYVSGLISSVTVPLLSVESLKLFCQFDTVALF